MRTHKYRAWVNNKMVNVISISWHYGVPCIVETDKMPTANDFILMQYTGLLDKNAKEIYEGDIVQYFLFEKHSVNPQEGKDGWYKDKDRRLTKRFLRVIEYSSERGAYRPFGFHSYDCAGGEVEVIGNIYDNPELIKET